MRNPIIALCLAMGAAQAVIAQHPRMPPSATQVAEAQRLLNQYSSQYRNTGRAGRNLLDAIHAHASWLPKTADNVQTVRVLLASNITPDEKIGLVRILGNLYTHDNQTGKNEAIVQDLRDLVHSAPRDIATAAALVFSRLAYFPDSQALLKYAKEKGYIDMDTYFGELAHLVAYAPASEQHGLIAEIGTGKNRYAAEILVSGFVNQEVLAKTSPETKRVLKQYLVENEPEMPNALGEFDITGMTRYANWLHAIATLSASTGGHSYDEAVFNRLNDEKTDPRKIMAFLGSYRGELFIRQVGRKALFDNAIQRAAHYSRQLPGNAMMRDTVASITTHLNALRD